MTAVISGSGNGLYQSSLNVLGSRASSGGDPAIGRFGGQAYVNATTGNLVLQQGDEFLSTLGPDLSLVRTYNSLGLLNDDNGDNWRLSVHERLVFGSGIITKTFGDGAEVVFTLSGTIYSSTAGSGAHDTIQAQGTNWVYSDGDGNVTETYNSAGQLIGRQDRDGNGQTFTYTGNLLTGISDTSGQTVQLVYSGNNLQSIVTSSSGVVRTRVRYHYDTSNRLDSVTVDLTPHDSTDTQTFVTTYTYDGASKRVKTVNNSDGAALTIVYYTDGRVFTVTDGEGRTSTYNYFAGYTTLTDALNRETIFRYDAQGRLTNFETPPITVGVRIITQYQYDTAGNVIRVIDGAGRGTDFNYDAQGNLTRQQDAAGNVVEYRYTATNQLACQIVYLATDPDGVAGPLQATEPRYTHYVYDVENHLRFVVTHDGRVTEHRYNPDGTQRVSFVYAGDTYIAGDTTPLEATLVAWTGNTARNYSARTRTDRVFDFRGALSIMTEWSSVDAVGQGVPGAGSTTYYIYDQAGRLLKTVGARGAPPTETAATAPNLVAYRANNYETLYVYDGLGRLLGSTDPLGVPTFTNYDDANRAVRTTIANGLIRASFYDRNGRLVSVTETDSLATALGNTRYVYDNAGQLRATQDPGGDITHVIYDAAGRAVATIDSTGTLSEVTYGKNNTPKLRISYATRVASALLDQLVVRNGAGELTGVNAAITLDQLRPVSSPQDRRTYTLYDEALRLVYEFDAEGYVTETRYNGASEVVDTIRHETPFPGFIDNGNAGVDITWDQGLTTLSWVQNMLSMARRLTFSLTKEETGEGIGIDFNLLTNTGTVNVTRPPLQAYSPDSFGTTDTRTATSTPQNVALAYAADTVPPPSDQLAVDATASYAPTLQAVALTIGNTPINSGVVQDGTKFTVSDIDYKSAPPPNNVTYWDIMLTKKNGSGVYQSYGMISMTFTPDKATFTSLPAGDYMLYTVAYVASSSHPPTPTGPTGAQKFFTVGTPTPLVVNFTTLNYAADFYYRPAALKGADYTGKITVANMSPNYSVTLPPEYANTAIDYKIVFKTNTNVPIKVAFGTITMTSGGSGSTSAYKLNTGAGSLLIGALTAIDVGTYGDERGTTLKFVDVNVYNAATGALVSSQRTEPSLIAALTGITDGRINLSVGAPLANGVYRIDLVKTYNNSSFNQTVTLDSDFQVGNLTRHTQTVTWPASTQLLQLGDTAVFSYRKVGDAAFQQVSFRQGSAQARTTYFVQEGDKYKVYLYGLQDNATYEYKVEYRAADKRLLQWTGSQTFTTRASASSGVAFLKYNDQSIAATGGTRLTGFLSPEDTQAVDYLSVDVLTEAGATVSSGVLTIPRVEENYLGALNLTSTIPLSWGRYTVRVTRYFKDPARASQTDVLTHEVGPQNVGASARPMTVTVNGSVITATISGSLAFAGSITLTMNRATNEVSLVGNLDQGPYTYSKTLTASDMVLPTLPSRFAVSSSSTPDLYNVRKFYERERVTPVSVVQGTSSTDRAPTLPAGYGYQTSAPSTATSTTTSTLDVTAHANGKNSANVRVDSSIDITSAPAGVWKAISIVDVTTGAVVWTEPLPDMSARESLRPINQSDYLRQGPRPSFTLPNLAPGDYRLDVSTVVVTYTDYRVVGSGPIPDVYIKEHYGWGPTTSFNYNWKNIPSTATVSWTTASQPAGTTVSFFYGPGGAAATKSPTSLQSSGGKFIAGFGAEPAGWYTFRIEYRDRNGQLVKESSGMFKLAMEQDALTTNPTVQYNTVATTVNGSSITSTTLTALGAAIKKVEAKVYDAAGALVSKNANGAPGSIFTYIPVNQALNSVALTRGAILANGVYRVDMTVTYTTDDHVEVIPSVMIEIGPQPVSQPATELRWDGRTRPANTDVFFRYKPVAQYEFDPQNMWIRATASQTVQGEFYVRFPQMTPDGRLLASLPPGQYDYMVVYAERGTGKTIESALGRFSATPGGATTAQQLVFARDLEGRHTRIFTNDLGQTTATLNALGYLSENRYDGAGRLVEIIRYASPTSVTLRDLGTLDQLRPVADAKDLHEYFYYNAQGRLILSVDAERYVTEYRYDAAGNQTQAIRYASRSPLTNIAGAPLAGVRPASTTRDRATESTYNAVNLVTTVTQKVGTDVVSILEYEYDNMGQLVRTTTAKGAIDERTVRARYDLQGRIVAELTGEGSAALAALSSPTPAQIDAIWTQYGMRYAYDKNGNLINQADQNAHATRYYYDALGRTVFSINAAGEVAENVYNTFGEISSSIQYANRLSSVALAGLNGGFVTQAVRTVMNTLRDPLNDSAIGQDYDHRGLVVRRTDELGNDTRYEYDGFGEQRFLRQIIHGGANDGSEHTLEYIYDKLGRRTNELSGVNGAQINQGHDYDAFNREITSYTYDSTLTLREHYSQVYDRLGQVTEQFEVIDPGTSLLRKVNGYSYDAFARVLMHVDGNSQTTTYNYNDTLRIFSVTTPENITVLTRENAHGETTQVVDGAGKSTFYAYDKNGQLTGRGDAEGGSTQFDYDDAGLLIDTTDARGIHTETRYDAANRLIRRVVHPTGLALTTLYDYDAAGRTIRVTDPENIVTQTYYDKKGQVTRIVVDPDPAVPDGRTHLNQATFYRYDSRGLTLTVSIGESGWVTRTNPDGTTTTAYEKALNTTRYDHDIHGRVIREVVDPDVSYTDTNGQVRTIVGLKLTTEYAYDASDNIAAKTDGRGYTTRYAYDKFNRLVFSVTDIGNDRGQVTKNIYDANGNVTSVARYATAISLYGLNRVVDVAEVQSRVTVNPADQVERRVYDKDDRLTFVISATGLVTRNVYDKAGNVAQTIAYPLAIANIDYTGVAQVEQALAGQDIGASHRVWNVFDANGRVLYHVDGSGYLTAYTYDKNGNRWRAVEYARSVNLALVADPATARAQLDAALPALADAAQDRVTRYTFDAANRQVHEIDALGYVTQTVYDRAGRATQRIVYGAAVGGLPALPYTANVQPLLPSSPGIGDRVTRSVYDAADRVIEAVDAENGHEFFDYDAAGNRTRYVNAKGDAWTYRYDGANRLVEERTPPVSVTRLDATLWEQNFDANLAGVGGALLANGSAYGLAGGQFVLKEGAGTPMAELHGLRQYDPATGVRFETTFKTGADVSQLEFTVGAANVNGLPLHRLHVVGGRLLAKYGSALTDTVDLGAIEANTTYVVEVAFEGQSTRLSVYKQGEARSAARTDIRSSNGWTAAQWSMKFASHAGAATNALYIDRVRELMPRRSALVDEAAVLTDATFTESITTSYEYDALDNLTARTEAVGAPEQRRTEYVYDAVSRQISTIYPEVGVYDYIDASLTYASARQETLQRLSTHTYFDVFGNAVLGVDTAGNKSYKVYDADHRLVYDIDASGYVTENRYDAFGNVTELVRYANAIALPADPIELLNPGLSRAQVLALLQPNTGADRRLTTQYDALNRAIRMEQSAISYLSSYSQGSTVVGSASPTTRNRYDGFGQLVGQSTLAAGDRWIDTNFYYDRDGRRIATLDPGGFLTVLEYDAVGNLTHKIEYAEAIAVSVDRNNYAAVLAAVHPAHLTQVDNDVSALGAAGLDRETAYVYDRLNRVVAETQIDVIVSDTSVSGAGTDAYQANPSRQVADLTTERVYDALGNLVMEKNAQQNVVYRLYDVLGRVTAQTEVGPQSAPVPLTRFQHDVFGDVVKQTRYANRGTLTGSNINVASDGAHDQVTYLYYDAFGRAVHSRDAEGQGIFFSYDNAGNLAKEWRWITVEATVGVPGNELFAGKVYRYDATGRQTQEIDVGETVSIGLDGITRVYAKAATQLQYNAFGEVIRRGLNDGAQEYFEYDRAGRLWRTNAEDGVDKIYLYDLQGNRGMALTSAGRDLSSSQYGYAALSSTVMLASDIRRIAMYYDDLGRMTQQVLPMRVQDGQTLLPQITRAYDRWSNLTQLVDANSAVSDYRYDHGNRQLRQALAAATVVDEHGVTSVVRPTSYMHYDVLGRALAAQDANGHTQVREYDAAGHVLRDIAGDGGIQRYNYDAFGNVVSQYAYAGTESSDAFGSVRTYDRNNRLVREQTSLGGDTIYVYDEAGNRTHSRRLVSVVNGTRRYETSLYRYDNRGNLIEETLNGRIETVNPQGVWSSQVNYGAVVHRYAYDIQKHRSQEQRYPTTLASDVLNASWQYDYFGHLVDHVDFGGGDYGYLYDFVGELRQDTVARAGQNGTRTYFYYEDGALKLVINGGDNVRYKYDLAGHTTDEIANAGAVYSNHYTYDALGRLTRMTGDGGATLSYPGRGYYVDMQYQYDATGNRRRVYGAEGKNSGQTGLSALDQWYTYDAADRVLISRGKLAGGNITINGTTDGLQLAYDKAGHRKQTTRIRDNAQVTESHEYDADGNLRVTREGGQYTSKREYDLAGRMLTYTSYSSPGVMDEVRISSYNDNGNLAQQLIYGTDGGQQTTLKAKLSYDLADSYDGTGALKHYQLVSFDQTNYVNDYLYQYNYFDDAKARTITGSSSTSQLQPNTATHTYDVFGNLLSVSNSNAQEQSKNLTYTVNAIGQVVHKQTESKHQFYYNANGITIGTGGEFEVDFDYNTKTLSADDAVGTAPGTYVVRAGDMLENIALAVYGDAGLWYLIADANGLQSNADLTVGRTLTIPRVDTQRNSAEVFKPFGTGRIIGNTVPNLPMAPPPRMSMCSVVANVVLIVVAVVVTAYTTGLAAGFLNGVLGTSGGLGVSVAAAAVGGAAGNIASQVVGIGLGAQNGFEWKKVAASAVGASVTAGLGSISGGTGMAGLMGLKEGSWAAAAVNAMAGNVANQGVGITLGLQNGFDWRSLVVATVSAAVVREADTKLHLDRSSTSPFGNFAKRFAHETINGLAGQSASFLVNQGGKFDVVQVVTDAFGNAIANAILTRSKPRPHSNDASVWSGEVCSAGLDGSTNGSSGQSMGGAGAGDGTGTGGGAGVGDGDGAGSGEGVEGAGESGSGGGTASMTWGESVDIEMRNAAGDLVAARMTRGGTMLDLGMLGMIPLVDNMSLSTFEAPHFYPPMYQPITVAQPSSPEYGQPIRTLPAPHAAQEDAAFFDQAATHKFWADMQSNSTSVAGQLGYGAMGALAGAGFAIANTASAMIDDPASAGAGAGKGVVNYGPESFNGMTNFVKSAADQVSLTAEWVSGSPGYYSQFRNTNAYNIEILAPTKNAAEAGGSMMMTMAMGAAETKFGNVGIGKTATGEVKFGRFTKLSSEKDFAKAMAKPEPGVNYRHGNSKFRLDSSTNTRTLSLENGDAIYTIDHGTGLTIRADGKITGPHPGRGKGYRPDPDGYRRPGDHRGHLIPEGSVDNPDLVNRRENLIWEAPGSNLKDKRYIERAADVVALNNRGSKVRFISEPLRDPGMSRPFAVTHYVLVDGVVVEARTIRNF